MTGRLGAWAVPRQTLILSAVATVVLIAAIVVAYLAGGTQGALAIGLGSLASLRPALSRRTVHAFALAIPAAMAAGVAVALRGQPLVAAFFVVLCCLLVAPAGMLQDGMLGMVPGVAAVLVLVPGEFQPGRTVIWMLIGGGLVVALATRLPRNAPARGVEQPRAWLHAAVMAVAVGTVVYVVDTFGLPHGYWVALTLTAVLLPFDLQTLRRSSERVLATTAAALLALVATLLLPLWALLVLLVASTLLATGYALTGDHTRQMVFLTPAVVLLGSAGHPFEIASQGAFAAPAGALLVAAIALGLAAFENRRTPVTT